MHLHYPRHGSSASLHATPLHAFFSPPRQNQSTNNRAFFSIFYTVTVVFSYVVTLVYWLILVPHKQTSRELDFTCDVLYFWYGFIADLCKQLKTCLATDGSSHFVLSTNMELTL